MRNKLVPAPLARKFVLGDGTRAFLWLKRLLGIDFHILQTLLLRGWSVIAGGVMVLFVPHWFGAVEQGYYYTFLSLIAVQIFFELGMNQIIVQLVSHEAAHLDQAADGTLTGSRARIARLASLTQLVTRWYQVAALFFFVGGGSAGVVFFLRQDAAMGMREIAIWLTLVLFTALNLALSPALAMLEGFGRVGDVAQVRLAQSVLGYSATWLALTLGAGLLAAPMLAGVGALCTGYWLARHDRLIAWLRRIQPAPNDARVHWRTDVFPLQWRIALSWASGYLILQLLVPMAFSHQGAVQAGQLGLTLTIFNSLLSIGLSWTNARLPVIAAHLARGERPAARAVLLAVMVRSTAITALGSLAVLILVMVLPPFMRDRFTNTSTLLCLSLATVVNCVIYGMATFARAHKEEPLLVQSIISAIIMVPTVYFSSYVSVTQMMTAFASVITLVALPWVTVIFLRYYRREA